MKKSILYCVLFLSIISLSSFIAHKFYVSIYQINYAQDKKMIQITSRIFYDDLNMVLKKKFNKTTHIGESDESEEDIQLMKKYISDHFLIKVNGKQKSINYLSKEIEANIVICYFKITDVAKIKSLEIENTALFELDSNQQNIIQTTIYNKKQNLLLTPDNVKGLLNH
ncbi:DUF6702 family protein [Flavobacterium sp.]|uniref:DUF6702 family protein n=1 Tax=Flavobacterium sp. TaxID=239 RepID=UPI00374CF3B4